MEDKKNIVEAMLAARNELSAVLPKKNQGHGYRYVGHRDVIEHVRDAFQRHGVLFGPPKALAKPEEIGRTKNGSSVLLWHFTYCVYHVSGESLDYQISASTLGNDKCAFVANTAAERTLLLRLAGLAGGDAEDPEQEANESW